MLSHLVENVQMLRQVQCLPEENAKLETSTHFQSFSLLQQGVKCKDCKRNKWSTSSPETGSISIIRGGVRSDPLEHERKGFGSRLLTGRRNRIELAATSPSRQVSWRWSPLAGKQAGGAWAVPRRQVEQHLVCTMTPCSAPYCCCTPGHIQEQICRCYKQPQRNAGLARLQVGHSNIYLQVWESTCRANEHVVLLWDMF